MKAPTIEKSPVTQKKKTSNKRSQSALAMCPVNGAGWCPYPFSPAQLERRLKQIEEAKRDSKEEKRLPRECADSLVFDWFAGPRWLVRPG